MVVKGSVMGYVMVGQRNSDWQGIRVRVPHSKRRVAITKLLLAVRPCINNHKVKIAMW